MSQLRYDPATNTVKEMSDEEVRQRRIQRAIARIESNRNLTVTEKIIAIRSLQDGMWSRIPGYLWSIEASNGEIHLMKDAWEATVFQGHRFRVPLDEPPEPDVVVEKP